MAYCRNKRVVPIGIFGVKVGTVPPPLGLLQGFNLDSPQGIDRIIKVLNDAFFHEHHTQSSTKVFNAFVGRPVTPLTDGERRYRVFAKTESGERACEMLWVEINQSRMTVRARSWESVGIIVENRFVGRFKYLRGSSPDDVGMHDFRWNGQEFVGSAKVDSGRWFAESLSWRPWSVKAGGAAPTAR